VCSVRTTLDPRLVDPAGNEPGLVVGVRDQARRKSHLTARQAGEIAALPRARKVVPFRFSPRQRGDEALLREEVAAARRQGAGERGERRRGAKIRTPRARAAAARDARSQGCAQGAETA
jgi:hypothetical protein